MDWHAPIEVPVVDGATSASRDVHGIANGRALASWALVMASVRRIPVIRHGGDVYAADETKVHTFSRQAIAAMLQTAESDEACVSSAPPPAPPSGVRLKDGSPCRAPARMTPVPPPPALPAVWAHEEDDDEGLVPTTLHERAQALTEADLLVDEELGPPPPSSSPALASLTPPSSNVKITIAPETAAPMVLAPVLAPVAAAPSIQTRTRAPGIDWVTVAIFVVTFVGTIAAALRWVL